MHRPISRGVSSDTLLTNSLGDGSTLSLDFTTGVLDPRLTFTRGSNATFINSSGLVEWANANMYWNTAFEGLSGTNPSLTSSGWGYVFSSGNAVFNSDGTVTMTTTAAQRVAIFRSSGFLAGGLRVVASVDVTIHSGSLQASQVIVTGTPANAQHYVNGIIWNSSHPLWNGGILPVGTAFNIAYATDGQTSGTTSMYFGVGATSAIAGSATFVNPRWTMWKGSATVPYYPNTSATNNSTANYYKSNDYQAPRFDYDPTTIGSPRGLLIEGSATNRLFQSSAFSTSPWSPSSYTYTGTGITSPDGTTLAQRWTVNTGTLTPGNVQLCSNVTSTSVTLSLWWKNGNHTGSTPANLRRVAIRNESSSTILLDVTITNPSTTPGISYNTGSSGASLTPYQNGWYRLVLTVTSGITSGNNIQTYVGGLFGSTTGSGEFCYWWGAQLEDGFGASSYIPTGASTVTRNADNCVTAIANLTGFNANQGTIYEAWRDNTASDTSTVQEWAFAFGLTAANGVGIFVSNAASGTFGVNGGISNTGDAGPAGTYVIGGVNKAAIAIDVAGTSLKLSANGSAVATGTNIGGYSTAQTFSLGQRNNNTRYLNGWIRQFKYWPYLLPDAQLQALTT